MNKIIRTICYFTDAPSQEILGLIDQIADILIQNQYTIQTKRVCSSSIEKIRELDMQPENKSYFFSIGTLDSKATSANLKNLCKANNIGFNLDLTKKQIRSTHVEILLEIIKNNPNKTFNFTYVFNNAPSSPFFPSATFHKNGFSIGLQPTDLAENCQSLEEWLRKLKNVWSEIFNLFKNNNNFLGIDSSIAPLYTGKSSLVNFIKRLSENFSQSVTSSTYLKITKYLKQENPKPVGLCGLMFPCLEDFELAEEYEKGNFSIERNLFLSLHCGLGIDTYPVGIDEKPERILEILILAQNLSNKYTKPLSARFVSDGKARIGETTDFQNQYLKDIMVRSL